MSVLALMKRQISLKSTSPTLTRSIPQYKQVSVSDHVGSMNLMLKLAPITKEIVCASTGPDGGITDVPDLTASNFESSSDNKVPGIVAGCSKWDVKADFAYGLALSLYERNVDQGGLCGDPIADVFAIVARPNCAILAVADGVNWGVKPRLAAKCAVLGAMETINTGICGAAHVQDVMQLLDDCVLSAQAQILAHHATLTTLSVAVVVQLADSSWRVCTMQVGDSPILVYQPSLCKVVEVGRDLLEDSVKDFSDSGGCLGPSKGHKPDLSNLTFCSMPVLPGDIVFVSSDGIADNYRTGCMSPDRRGQEDCLTENLLSRLEIFRAEVLHLHKYHFTAQDVSACLAGQAKLLTDEKRTVSEEVQREGVSRKVLQTKNPELYARLKSTPGKLDHACVVAYEVRQLVNR